MNLRNACRLLRRDSCLVMAIAALLFSCKPKPSAPPPTEVTITRPISKEVTEWDDFTGRLEPIKSVEVRARVSGYLDSIHFKDGQTVKAGDLLFVIDRNAPTRNSRGRKLSGTSLSRICSAPRS